MAPKMVALNKKTVPQGLIYSFFCEKKCSGYAVNNIKKMILCFDPCVIIIKQDGDQEDHNIHTLMFSGCSSIPLLQILNDLYLK